MRLPHRDGPVCCELSISPVILGRLPEAVDLAMQHNRTLQVARLGIADAEQQKRSLVQIIIRELRTSRLHCT